MQDSSHSHSKLRILSQSTNGYIGQCNCCDHYNFVFGNFLFIFTEDGLNGFRSVLYDQQHIYELDAPLRNGKNILFPSPIPNFMLSFSVEELEEVRGLFQETLLVMEVNRVLSHHK